MGISNPSGQFGASSIVVDPTPGVGSFVTIAAAASAASTGDTIYIRPGTYTESIVFPSGINFIGSTTGSTSSEISIVGNQTFNVVGSLSFENISFSSAAGDTWTYTSPAPPGSTLELNSCSITASSGNALSSSPVGATIQNLNIGNSTLSASGNAINASGNSILTLKNSTLKTTTDNINAIDISGATSINSCMTTINNSGVGTGACISLNGATNSVISDHSTYNAGSLANATAFLFTIAGGSVRSILDQFFVTGTFFARSTGAFGALTYGNSTIGGGISLIDPQITQTILQQEPNSVPTVDGEVLIGATGLPPVLSTITQGAGISVTNGAGSITIAATGTGLTWNSIVANQTLAVNNGYIVATGALSLLLPAASVVGDEIKIILDAGTSWVVTQAASQQIRLGNFQTTAGVTGTLASTASGDSISFVCTVANLEWAVYATQGNITIT